MIGSRQVAISGVLGAITVILGVTGLGFIPFPTLAGRATIMHIPVILAGILEGPLVGLFVGLIFGVFSLLQAGSPMIADPLIAIGPRLLIGVVAWAVYRLAESRNRTLGSSLAAVAGTLTNTAGVLGLALWRGYLPNVQSTLLIAVTHGIPEVVVAALLVPAIVRAIAWGGKKGTH